MRKTAKTPEVSDDDFAEALHAGYERGVRDGRWATPQEFIELVQPSETPIYKTVKSGNASE